jgi:hypothetical protein
MIIKRMPIERAASPALTLATLALCVACDRGHRDTPSAPLPVPPAVQKPATSCTLAAIPTTVPLTPKRLVAIGDLHGDLGGARAALRAAGAIASLGSADASDRWVGGDLVIVQTGDILDRGDDESKIFDLLERLDAEARTSGGAIIQLNGNHELMNGAHDFRYVTPGGMRDFGGDRQRALEPGGAWAKKLAGFNIVAIVGGTVFSHAGVLGEWVTQLDAMNLSSRCWLDGQAGTFDDPPVALTSQESPVWTRAYGIPDAVDCAALDATLGKLGAQRMVVGHTVQKQGITSACDGKLWRIDVGLAAGYGGPIEVLEIAGGAPRVLRGTR